MDTTESTTTSPWRRRTAVVAACLLSAAVAQWLASRSASTVVDPELATLLRGMALIKGLLVTAAIGAVWWRCGWPVASRSTWGYGLGLAAMAGATVLIAHLAWIAAAAVVFHIGALTVMVVAWRDGGLVRGGLVRGQRSCGMTPRVASRAATAVSSRIPARESSSLPGLASLAR